MFLGVVVCIGRGAMGVLIVFREMAAYQESCCEHDADAGDVEYPPARSKKIQGLGKLHG